VQDGSRVVDDMIGVAVLDNIMYVVCTGSSKILLYSMDTFSRLDVVIDVDGMRPSDMVVCHNDRQLYIAECRHRSIWRVSVDDHSDQQEWPLTESPADAVDTDMAMSSSDSSDVEIGSTLSLTSRRLLVTPYSSYLRLRQYSTTDRRLLRIVNVPDYVKRLVHSIETKRGTFVVAHEGTSEGQWQNGVSEPFRFLRFISHKDRTFIITACVVATFPGLITYVVICQQC